MQFPSNVLVLLLVGACAASAAIAQSYPSKPLRIMSGDAGGASDLIARAAAQGIQVNLGQPAVVINRPGIQVVPVTEAAKSAPDGYTLLAVGANQFWLAPFLQKDVPYDPVKDFLPITISGTAPYLVAVHPSVQANNIRELIALAKARPGVLNYGSGNIGSANHLAAELFKALSQTNIVAVPYKSAPLAMVGLLAGDVHISFASSSTAMAGVKSGKLRVLGVSTDRPSALAPGVPTVTESGLPGYEATLTYAVFAPAKTPAGIISQVNGAIVKHLQAPDIKEKMFAAGVEIVASTPQALAAAMKQDMERMGKVIRDTGIRAE